MVGKPSGSEQVSASLYRVLLGDLPRDRRRDVDFERRRPEDSLLEESLLVLDDVES